jgi:hypothetical protein
LPGTDKAGWRRLWPYGVLLAEVLVFHWRVLFTGQYVLPWDFRYFHLPMAELQAHALRTRQLPLWDPFSYFGRPLVANIQAQNFYPPRLLTLALNHLAGGGHLLYLLELQQITHVFLAGVFTYRLLIRLGAGQGGALAGATVYQLGGFFASQAQHLGVVNAGAWLPLAWLGVLELRDRITVRGAAKLAAALTLVILAGLPSLAAGAIASTVLLALGAALVYGTGARLAAAAMAAAVWAALLAAVQLLPSIQLNFHSIAQYRPEWRGTGGGIPLPALVSLVAPNHYGIFDLATYSKPWEPTFLYLYSSLAGLVLALAAALRWRRQEARLFGLFTVVMALAMLGDQTPAGRALYRVLPAAIRAGFQPEFLMPNFTLSLAVLSGLGTGWYLKRRALACVAVAVIAVDLTAVGSGRPMNTASIAAEPGVTRTAFQGSEELLGKIRLLVHQARPPYRLDVIDDTPHWGMTAPLTRIPTGTGYDPMAPARVIRLRLAFARGERWGATYAVEDLASPALDLANIRYLLSRNPVAESRLAAAKFRHVADLPGRRVYENLEVLPRFYLVGRVRPAESLEEAAQALRDSALDPRAEAIVEGRLRLAGGAGGQVKVISYRENGFELEVEAPQAAYLVTSETHYPGWKAWVDGREAPLYYTNVAFRGLPVPAGRHRVVMRFAPGIVWIGAAISGLSLGTALLPWLRRRG